MLNGDGLRVVLWLSGCNHNCYNCQNPQTHDPNSGILFDKKSKEELFEELNKDYISGLTLTGGDPLHENNLEEVLNLVNQIRLLLPEKTIWLYTGYEWEIIQSVIHTPFAPDPTIDELIINHNTRKKIVSMCDVLIDGRYIDSQKDVSLKWCGSSNQRVIDIQKTLKAGEIVLWR